jgi:hypothetical protein
MCELFTEAAERAIRYLEGLNERGVAPDPTVVARLAELDVPLPAGPSPAEETLALLDSYNAATMAMVGPRFFGFVIGGVLPAGRDGGFCGVSALKLNTRPGKLHA